MPDRFTPEEFGQLMKQWDGAERSIVDERLRSNYTQEVLAQFSQEEAITMRAVLERLIPQSEGVDLAGFIDATAGIPFGRGDRAPGMPGETELFHQGLIGIDQSSVARHGRRFIELADDERDDLLRALQKREAEGEIWESIASDYFFKRFYSKALHGYFAHPRVWMRIGFMGASYPEGYTWIDRKEVGQRHDRQAGWDIL